MSEEINIELVKGGKREKKIEEINLQRPYAIQALQLQILYDIADMLNELTIQQSDFNMQWQETITEGILEGAEINVTDQLKSVLRESGYKDKWFEMTIFNDGTDDVYVSSTETRHGKPLIIKDTDQLKLTAKKGTKRTVWVWCKKGESATIRVGFER